MKNPFNRNQTLVTFILGISIASGALAANQPKPAATLETNSAILQPPASSETNVVAPINLGFYVENGVSNKIASVYSVSPIHVQVKLAVENGTIIRKIPRNELPPELAAKFPYDADKAAAFNATQAANEVQARATQLAAQREALVRRVQLMDAEIQKLNAKDEEMERQIALERKMPVGFGKKGHIRDWLKEQQGIKDSVRNIKQQQAVLRQQL